MRLISVTFPVIRYFPRVVSDNHIIYCIFLCSPRELKSSWDLPVRSEYVPGGILDSSGLDFPIIDVVNAREIRPWWAVLSDLIIGSTIGYEPHLRFGTPAQLTVDEFRRKFIGLLIKQKGFSRSIKRIQAATTYYGIMAAQFDHAMTSRRDPPLTMEIEVPD